MQLQAFFQYLCWYRRRGLLIGGIPKLAMVTGSAHKIAEFYM